MNSIPIDWAEISKSKKGVSSPGNEILVIDGVINLKKYRIPKSKVNFYNGSELVLEIPTFLMQKYEYK